MVTVETDKTIWQSLAEELALRRLVLDCRLPTGAALPVPQGLRPRTHTHTQGRGNREEPWSHCHGFEADNQRIDNLLNLKWHDKPGGQLPGLHLERELSGQQPYLLSRPIRQGGSPVPVCYLLVPSSGLLEHSTDSPPHSPKALNVCLDRRNRHLLLLVQEDKRLETLASHKGRHTCDG